MHPDKYFAHVKPTKPELPKLEDDVKQREITEGSMGEFDHNILLRQYLGDAKANPISRHLRGGLFKIIALGKSKHPVLLYASQWDSTTSAADYFAAYKKVLHAKWKHMDETVDNKEKIQGTGDNGYFEARLIGDRVMSVEGMQKLIAITY
jgi:hypothetical protein